MIDPDGVRLMIAGMSTVFGFLTLMVAVMEVSARVFASWPEDAPPPTPRRRDNDDEELARIAVAIAAATAAARTP